MKRLSIILCMSLLSATLLTQTEPVTEVKQALVTPSGFLQAGYNYSEDVSTFLLRRARLVLAGDLYKGDAGKADYKLQVELTGTPKILDLYFRYKPIDEFGIKLGQFKSPLSIENSEYNPTKLEFINYSLVVQRLARMSKQDLSGFNQNGRDLGFEFLGSAFKQDDYSLLNYELAIFNGYTLNANDNNKGKDIVGRIIVNPFKELSIAGYYQWGEGALPTYDEATQKFTAQTEDNYVQLQRYGGGVAYKAKKGFARAEYIAGKTGELNSGGFYVAGGYEFIKNWTAVARLDYFDDDIDNKDYSEQDYTIGINYAPWKPVNLKLNYTLQNYKGRDNASGIYFLATIKY